MASLLSTPARSITNAEHNDIEDWSRIKLQIIEALKIIINCHNQNANQRHEKLEGDTNDELDDIDDLIGLTQQKIREYSRTSELNKDTQESFDQVIAGMDITSGDTQSEFAQASIRLTNAKKSLDYVLKTYFPNHHEELKSILTELESAAKENGDQYVELDDDSGAAVIILKRALLVDQHPDMPTYFKLASLQ